MNTTDAAIDIATATKAQLLTILGRKRRAADTVESLRAEAAAAQARTIVPVVKGDTVEERWDSGRWTPSSGHEVVDGPAASEVETVTVEAAGEEIEVEAATPTADDARLAEGIIAIIEAAKAERDAEKAWIAAGADEAARPATPNLDEVRRDYEARQAGERSRIGRKTTGTAKRAANPRSKVGTFVPQGDTHTCPTCEQDRPVTAFPTITGKTDRVNRCRPCVKAARDAAKA